MVFAFSPRAAGGSVGGASSTVAGGSISPLLIAGAGKFQISDFRGNTSNVALGFVAVLSVSGASCQFHFPLFTLNLATVHTLTDYAIQLVKENHSFCRHVVERILQSVSLIKCLESIKLSTGSILLKDEKSPKPSSSKPK